MFEKKENNMKEIDCLVHNIVVTAILNLQSYASPAHEIRVRGIYAPAVKAGIHEIFKTSEHEVKNQAQLISQCTPKLKTRGRN